MPKRKRPLTPSTINKKVKHEGHFNLDDPDVYEVREILQETSTQYLISWAPNRVTGEEYPPDWQPKSFVNQAAIDDWEEQKEQGRVVQKPTPAKRGRGRPRKSLIRKHSPSQSSVGNNTQSHSSPAVRTRTQRPRNRRTILDSSQDIIEPSQSHTKVPYLHDPSPDVDLSPEIPQTQGYGSDSRSRSNIVIEIPVLSTSQVEDFDIDHFDTFDSSQVITGTAPQPEISNSTDQESSGLRIVDAAGAPDLTQKHSPYSDSSKSDSPEDTTGSAERTDSSQKPLPTPTSEADAPFVSESQSRLDSQSYQEIEQIDTSQSTEHSNSGEGIPSPVESVEDITDSLSSTNRDRFRLFDRKRPHAEFQVTSAPTSFYHDFTHVSETLEEDDSRSIASAPIIISSNDHSTAASSRGPVLVSSVKTTSSQEPEATGPGTSRHFFLHLQSVGLSQQDAGTSSEGVASQQAHPRSQDEFISEHTSGDQSSTNFATQIHVHQHSGGTTTPSPDEPHTSAHASNEHAQESSLIASRQIQSLISDSFSLTRVGPPSWYPDTFASAPPRPLTPSSPLRSPNVVMVVTSPVSTHLDSSIRMQELRETGHPITPAQRSLGMTTRSSASRAGSPALPRDARSPSAVPSAEVIPMPTAEDNATSERYTTLVPDKPQDAKRKKKTLPPGITEDGIDTEISHDVTNTSSSEDAVMDTTGGIETDEYVVPVYFLGHQRDSYKSMISWERDFLEKYAVYQPGKSEMLDEKASGILQKLRHIISHPDLMNEESFTQVHTHPKLKAQWDKDSSAKFRFIQCLLADFSGHDLHIVIDLSAGRLFDIMDTFLTGLDVRHTRAGEAESTQSQDGLHVTLLSKSSGAEDVPRADLVIGFEGDITLRDEGRKALRQRTDGTMAPLVYLVVPQSAEHVERSFADHVLSKQRVRAVLNNAAILRKEAGYRQVHDQDVVNSASSLAKFLVDGAKVEDWPLDKLPDLQLQLPTSAPGDTQDSSTEDAQSEALRPRKRSLEVLKNDENDQEHKKVRIHLAAPSEPPSTIDPSSLMLSGVTDSADRHIVQASEYVSDMEAYRHEYESQLARVRDELAITQTRLAEHISALEDLQYRYEDQRTELVKTVTERDEAFQSASLAAAQLSSRETLVNKIKNEREEYKKLLDETRLALETNAAPEVVEFEALKTKVAEAEKQKNKLESRVQSLSKDLDYIRGMYQEASGRAAALAESTRELEVQVADLSKRAESSSAEAIRASQGNSQKQLQSEIKRLRLMLADRERVLHVRDEEIQKLKEKERGRMSTRGVSVPRSPGRLGSPMRLEPPRSSGLGSRAASPRRASPAAGNISGGKSRLGR